MKKFLSLVAILGCFFLGMKAQNYALVTSVDDLTADGEYILAYTYPDGKTMAMGSQNGAKYRNPVEVTRTEDVVTINDEVYPFNLVDGTTAGSKAIKFTTDGKYLICYGTANGNVKDSETLEANADFTISINDDNTFSIVFVEDGNECKLQYNSNANQERFTNYKKPQKNCNIYKKQIEAGEEGTIVLWQSPTAEGVATDGWARVYTMTAEEAQEKIGIGDYIILTVSYVNPEGGWPQVAVLPIEGWPPFTNEGVSKEATCPFDVRFPVTGPLAQQLYENGFGVSGGDVRISKVALEKATEEFSPNTIWFGGKQCDWSNGISLSNDLFANSLAGDKVVINYDPQIGGVLQLMPGGWDGPNFPTYVGLPFLVNDAENAQFIFTLQPDFGALEYEDKTYDVFSLLADKGLTMHGPCYVNSILYLSDYERQAANMEAYEAAEAMVQALYLEWAATEAEVEEDYPGFGDEDEAGAISMAIQQLYTKIQEELEAVAMEGNFENPVTEEEIAAIKTRIEAWAAAAKEAFEAAQGASVQTIAELKALEDGSMATFKANGAVVTFVMEERGVIFMEDETGAIMGSTLEYSDVSFTAGTAVSGDFSVYKEGSVVAFISAENVTATEADVTVGKVVTEEDLALPINANRLVTVKAAEGEPFVYDENYECYLIGNYLAFNLFGTISDDFVYPAASQLTGILYSDPSMSAQSYIGFRSEADIVAAAPVETGTIVLWESEFAGGVATDDWTRVYTMTAEEAQEKINVGDYLLVTVSYVNPEGGWPQVAVLPIEGWPPYINEGVSKEATCPFVVRFPIAGPTAQKMYENGFGVSGGDVRISKVELEKATEELDPNTVWFGGKQCNWGNGITLSKDLFANSLAGDKVVINYNPDMEATLQLLPGGWSGPNFPIYANFPFFVRDEAKAQMIFTLQPDFGAYAYTNEDGETTVYDIFELLANDGLLMHGPCYVNSILYISDYERQAANMEAYEAAEAMVQALYLEWAATEAEVEENYPGFGNEEEAGAIASAIQQLYTKIQEALEAVAMEGNFENPVTEEEITAIEAQIEAWAAGAKAEFERQSANMEAYEAAMAEAQALYNEWAAAEAEVEENYPGFGDEEEAGAIATAIQDIFNKIQEELEATAEEGTFVNPVTEEEIAAIKAQIAAWVEAAKEGFSGITAILNGEVSDAEIYTIAGVKVAAPVKGQVNIIRLNGKTYKVQVK